MELAVVFVMRARREGLQGFMDALQFAGLWDGTRQTLSRLLQELHLEQMQGDDLDDVVVAEGHGRGQGTVHIDIELPAMSEKMGRVTIRAGVTDGDHNLPLSKNNTTLTYVKA